MTPRNRTSSKLCSSFRASSRRRSSSVPFVLAYVRNLRFARLPAIRIIHPYPPPLEFLPVYRPDHLLRSLAVDLDPAIHLLHIHATQDFLPQIAHIENEL